MAAHQKALTALVACLGAAWLAAQPRQTPRRIVSLISSATEILYLLDLGERVVGVSHECDYPSEVAAKPRLTRSLVESAAASHGCRS